MMSYGEEQEKQRNVLALDSSGALIAGAATLILAPFLQSLHQWSPGFLRYIALANIAYGLFSGLLFFSFRRRHRIAAGWAAVLVAANGAWALQCLFQAWRLRSEASAYGLGHLLLEGAYVGALAWFEARIFRIAGSETGSKTLR